MDRLILPILLSSGLLIVTIIMLLFTVFKGLKEKKSEYLLFSLLIVLIIGFLLPVMMGMIQEFY